MKIICKQDKKMGYINKPGKINEHTWLIDAAFKDLNRIKIRNGHAAYLLKVDDNQKCLINPGSRSGAVSIHRALKKFNLWPPDKIFITHSHWDHTQGIIFFREQVVKDGDPDIEIYASEKAIPYLLDQSYNYCFDSEEIYTEHQNIDGVLPLVNGEKIKIGEDLSLEVIETPGHMIDHISLYDNRNKALFIGDTIGMHWFPDFYVCNSNSIYWDEEKYLESIEIIRTIDVEYLCIAHFGVFTEKDIVRFIDNSKAMYYKWMEIIDHNKGRLEDPQYITDELWRRLYKDFSTHRILKDTLLGPLINVIKYYKGKI